MDAHGARPPPRRSASGVLGRSLDMRGRTSPVPLAELMRAVRSMDPGEVVQVISDDRVFAKEVELWCERSGQELLGAEMSGGVCLANVRRTPSAAASRPPRPVGLFAEQLGALLEHHVPRSMVRASLTAALADLGLAADQVGRHDVLRLAERVTPAIRVFCPRDRLVPLLVDIAQLCDDEAGTALSIASPVPRATLAPPTGEQHASSRPPALAAQRTRSRPPRPDLEGVSRTNTRKKTRPY